jgi:mono/diheme cytochrome c family protein
MGRGSRRWASLVAALAVLTLLLSACGGGSSDTAPQSPKPTGKLANDAELLKGRVLFQNNCAECHGFSGEGGVGPTFNDGKLLRDFPDVAAQVAFVEQGKGVMPSFRGQLTAAQLHAVVRYEREVLSKRGG